VDQQESPFFYLPLSVGDESDSSVTIAGEIWVERKRKLERFGW
jgi:hypothetical protein